VSIAPAGRPAPEQQLRAVLAQWQTLPAWLRHCRLYALAGSGSQAAEALGPLGLWLDRQKSPTAIDRFECLARQYFATDDRQRPALIAALRRDNPGLAAVCTRGLPAIAVGCGQIALD
jgi:hypothetical protein